VETKLYEDLKFCWKAGYKLNQIKEYCNTTLSIDELQTEFKIMWENELQCWKLVKVMDELSIEDQRRIVTIPSSIRYISGTFITLEAARSKRTLIDKRKQQIADCFGVPRELLGVGDDNNQ